MSNDIPVSEGQNKKKLWDVNRIGVLEWYACAWYTDVLMEEQGARGHNIVLDRWAGASNPHPHPHPPPTHIPNWSSRDPTWPAVPNALLAVIQWRSGLRARQRLQRADVLLHTGVNFLTGGIFMALDDWCRPLKADLRAGGEKLCLESRFEI